MPRGQTSDGLVIVVPAKAIRQPGRLRVEIGLCDGAARIALQCDVDTCDTADTSLSADGAGGIGLGDRGKTVLADQPAHVRPAVDGTGGVGLRDGGGIVIRSDETAHIRHPAYRAACVGLRYGRTTVVPADQPAHVGSAFHCACRIRFGNRHSGAVVGADEPTHMIRSAVHGCGGGRTRDPAFVEADEPADVCVAAHSSGGRRLRDRS